MRSGAEGWAAPKRSRASSAAPGYRQSSNALEVEAPWAGRGRTGRATGGLEVAGGALLTKGAGAGAEAVAEAETLGAVAALLVTVGAGAGVAGTGALASCWTTSRVTTAAAASSTDTAPATSSPRRLLRSRRLRRSAGHLAQVVGAGECVRDRPAARLHGAWAEGGERLGQLGDRLDAPIHVLVEAGEDHRLQLRRHVGTSDANGRGRLGDDLGQAGRGGVGVEGRAAAEQLVEDGAERPDVGAARRRLRGERICSGDM